MARLAYIGLAGSAALVCLGCVLVSRGSEPDRGFSFATGAEGFGYVRPVADPNAVVQGILELTSASKYTLVNSGGRTTSKSTAGGPREMVYTTAWWLLEHEPTGRRFEITQISEVEQPRNMIIHEVDAQGDYVRVAEGDRVLSTLVRDADHAFAYWHDPAGFPPRRHRAIASD